MALIPPAPEPGQIVRVRQRQYLVEVVSPPRNPGEATLVSLSCVDDDAQGQPLQVLWEHEVDPEILSGESWDHVATRGFDPPRHFAAYLNTLRWNCVTATNPELFQAPFRAGIRIDAYQLEPLRKALLMPRVNLFIADDVGLGKTIEAGLIARELLLRRKAREIVVVCPPSMLYQWKDELEARFGLTFEIYDREFVARVRRERGYAINPWTTHSRFLVSQRLLIDEDYAAPLRDWLEGLKSGTLLILDEAHHAAPASGVKYAIDSKITSATRDLAPLFEHRLFLSATPHNGHSNSFSALLELLDPQRFCRGVPVSPELRDEVMVRRLKDDIREIEGGFPIRRIVQEDIRGLAADAPELRLAALLDRYRVLREERLAKESKRKQAAAAILITGLQQRLLSSIEAFASTLRVHRRTVIKQWEAAQPADADISMRVGELDLLRGGVGSDDDRAAVGEDDLRVEEEAQIEAVSAATAGATSDAGARERFAKEQQLLDEMEAIAEQARWEPDAKVRCLLEWMAKNLCPGVSPAGMPSGTVPTWSDERLLIFTEYDATKRYLQRLLEAAFAGTDRADERIAVFHGPTPPEEREAIKRAFNSDPAKNPLRILIATDAAREGLNLQSRCWRLFHFDLPWNPSRIEQRNGRIDRKLQPKPEVFCHYFFYEQRPEDRILQVLVRKTDTIRRELGSLSQVIDERIAERLSRGFKREEIDSLAKELDSEDLAADTKETVESELEGARTRRDAIQVQLDAVRAVLKVSTDRIGFREEPFRDALSSALEMMGAPGLMQIEGGDGGPAKWVFPAVERLPGADSTWADTLDTLRAPRGRDQRLWDWRRAAPIRPVIFQDPGVMGEDLVHLHLEQRVVQRLLGRFVAQGFVHHDLSRACLAQTTDAIPRVILVGRLSLYGAGAARLHEELIPVSAKWVDLSRRSTALAPLTGEAGAQTERLMYESLQRPSGTAIPDVTRATMQRGAATDVAQLLPHLKSTGTVLAKAAEQMLKDRGSREADAMRDILLSQKRRVRDTAKVYETPQLHLGLFSEDEARQVEANRRHWQKRLVAIDAELTSEPERVKAHYEVRARRIEPVGLVYLWPVTG